MREFVSCPKNKAGRTIVGTRMWTVSVRVKIGVSGDATYDPKADHREAIDVLKHQLQAAIEKYVDCQPFDEIDIVRDDFENHDVDEFN